MDMQVSSFLKPLLTNKESVKESLLDWSVERFSLTNVSSYLSWHVSTGNLQQLLQIFFGVLQVETNQSVQQGSKRQKGIQARPNNAIIQNCMNFNEKRKK
jgi:hypothetical protein